MCFRNPREDTHLALAKTIISIQYEHRGVFASSLEALIRLGQLKGIKLAQSSILFLSRSQTRQNENKIVDGIKNLKLNSIDCLPNSYNTNAERSLREKMELNVCAYPESK